MEGPSLLSAIAGVTVFFSRVHDSPDQHSVHLYPTFPPSIAARALELVMWRCLSCAFTVTLVSFPGIIRCFGWLVVFVAGNVLCSCEEVALCSVLVDWKFLCRSG